MKLSTKPTHAGPADTYASEVVRELMAMRWPRERAIAAVQGEERYVRQQFGKGTPPKFAAGVLARKVQSARGKKIVALARGGSALHASDGLASGARASRASRGSRSTSGDWWAGAEARHASVKSVGGRSGMATGSSTCKTEPSWQPSIFGEDMSGSALEALDESEIASPEAAAAFRRAIQTPSGGGLGRVHQYFKTQKDIYGHKLSRIRLPGALYVEKTGNTKVVGGPNYKERRKKDGKSAAATYASISSSCPDECAVRDNGCYAQQGKTAMTIRRLDKETRALRLDSLSTAASEAFSIFTSHGAGPVHGANAEGHTRAVPNRGELFLRVHVGGDSQTIPGTQLLAAAVADWIRRGGKLAWSYTHAWFKVPRAAWGPISVLASVDNPAVDGERARQMGYAPAVVVDSFGPLRSVQKTGKKLEVVDYDLFVQEMAARSALRHWGHKGRSGEGTLFIPCPAQVGEYSLSKEEFEAGIRDPRKGEKAGVGCLDCGLCLQANSLFKKNNGIMFEAHGPKTKRALEMLDEGRRTTTKGPRDTDTDGDE